MAEACLITGKRGEGKSLAAVALMQRYLREGRLVATNMDLNLPGLLAPYSKAVAYRLPDVPTAADFEALPPGNPRPVEEKRNGLLVLDEVGAWLNSREWNKGDRSALISWLLHSRKFGWDLALIAQHVRLVDAQVRDSLCELHGVARRLDKLRVPLVGGVWQAATGKPLRMPKVHVVSFFYGFAPGAPLADRMVFTGSSVWGGYDSLQKIGANRDQLGVSAYLSPWHVKGRYQSRWQMLRGAWFAGLLVGVLMGALGGFASGRWLLDREAVSVASAVPTVDASVKVQGYTVAADRFRVVLSDGRVEVAEAVQADLNGKRFKVGGVWFAE